MHSAKTAARVESNPGPQIHSLTLRKIHGDSVTNRVASLVTGWGSDCRKSKGAEVPDMIRKTTALILLTAFLSPELRANPLPDIWWSDRGLDTVRRASADGSNVEISIPQTLGIGEMRGFDVDFANGKVYWNDNGSNSIHRANLDASNPETLVSTDLNFPAGLVLDLPAGMMYWADSNNSVIERSRLDGSGRQTIVDNLVNPYFITIDPINEQLYWTDHGSDTIQRSNLDGSGVVDLVTIEGASRLRGIDLDLDAGKMYWTDRQTDLVQRSNLDGSYIETLYQVIPPAGVDSALHGIAVDVDRGHLYWVDNGTVKLQRANLDGSNVVDILTQASGELTRPWQIVMDLNLLVDRDPCDVNFDGRCNAIDMDTLTRAINLANADLAFDLNGDQQVDFEDRNHWIEVEMNSFYGDSNLDGEFNTRDFVLIFQAGEYEDDKIGNSTWATGDWNGDREFSSADFVDAFGTRLSGFEIGPRVAAVVPEPNGLALLYAALLTGLCRFVSPHPFASNR